MLKTMFVEIFLDYFFFLLKNCFSHVWHVNLAFSEEVPFIQRNAA